MGAMKLEEWTVMDGSAGVDIAGLESDIFCRYKLSNVSL